MNAELDEDIRAEHTFRERANVDKGKADKKRRSPEISQMYGAVITSRLVSGGEKTSYFYWETKERRDECLPRLLTKFIKPKVKLINKK